MTLKRYLNTNKFIALLTAALFSISLPGIPVQTLFAETNPSDPGLSISSQSGTIAFYPSSQKNSDSIIFIQDAHSNYEAQGRIRDILKQIVPQLNASTILVEGSSKGLNPAYFQFTASPVLNKQIAEELAKKGFVSGAELFSLEPEARNSNFKGIEDLELYNRERAAFIDVIRVKPETEKTLSILTSQLSGLKARAFGSTLKSIDRKFEDYENGKLSLLAWFDSLRKLVLEKLGFSLNDPRASVKYPNLTRLAISFEASKKLNPDRLNAEKKEMISLIEKEKNPDKKLLIEIVRGIGTEKRSADYSTQDALFLLYQKGQEFGLDWIQYPEIRKAAISDMLSSELESEELFQEMESLKDAIYERLAVTDKEKKVIRLDHDLRLLKSLLSLEATREVWNEAKLRINEISPKNWIRQFQDIDLSARSIDPQLQNEIEEAFRNAVLFYELAEERETEFMKRIKSELKPEAQKSVIVIGGGFHTDGLRFAALQNNYHFSVVQPRLEQKAGLDGYYQAVFQSVSQSFAASKMAAEPFSSIQDPEQPGSDALKAQILVEILNRLKRGNLVVTEAAPEVAQEINLHPALVKSGREVVLNSGRFELTALEEIGSAKSLGSDKEDKRLPQDDPRAVAKDVELTFEGIRETADELNRFFAGKAEVFVERLAEPEKELVDQGKKVKITVNVQPAETPSKKELRYRVFILAIPEATADDVVRAVITENALRESEVELLTAIPAAFENLAREKNPVLLSKQLLLFEDQAQLSEPVQAETVGEQKPVSTQAVVTDQTQNLFPAKTEDAIAALAEIGREAQIADNAVVEFTRAYTSALAPEKIGENLKVENRARLYLAGIETYIGNNLTVSYRNELAIRMVPQAESRAYFRAGENLNVRGIVEITLAPGAAVLIGRNVTLGNLTLIVGPNQKVVIGDDASLIGEIDIQPAEEIPANQGPEGQRVPALIVNPLAKINLKKVEIGPEGQLTIPPELTGRIEDLKIPSGQSLNLIPAPVTPGGQSPELQPLPNDNFIDLPFAEAVSLGPNVPEGLNLPPRNTPNFPGTPVNPNVPVNVPPVTPVIPPVTPPSLNASNPAQAQVFLDFRDTLSAGVIPEENKRLRAEPLEDEDFGSEPFFSLVNAGILTPVKSVSFDKVTAAALLEQNLNRLPESAARQFLAGLIHNIRNYRVSITVGISDPSGIYSLSNPDFRDSVAFHLDNNPNSVFRFIHLGPESEVMEFKKEFLRFGKRFEAVKASEDNWNSQLRGLLGEDLMTVVSKLPAAHEIENLEELYKGKHIAVALPKTFWRNNPELPHSSIVKVTSLAKDSKFSSRAAQDPKFAADVAFIETSLAQLVSIYKGNYRNLSRAISLDVFSYSEGRFSLNTSTLLAGLLEDIHQQALTLQKLSYQA